MKSLRPLLLVFATLVCPGILPSVSAASAVAPRDALPTLFVCGDSTADRDRPPVEGWGAEIGSFFDPAKIHVENRARAGRSARTFIAEGLWSAVQSQLRAGDVVLLQFGHNDSKSAMSLARYDLAGTGDEVETVPDARTGGKTEIHTYGYYLRKMIEDAKRAGASVVVLSPVPRCKWANGKIVRGEEEHGRWAAEVARAEQVPFVDANALIADVYDPIGQARIKALYFPQDNTHTNPAGAKLNAACIVTGLTRLDLPSFTATLAPNASSAAATLIAGVGPAAANIRLALPLRSAFPAPGATNACPDTPLRLTFASPPTLGTSGKIHIVDSATGLDVETIDLGARVATQAVGGEPDFRYYPVIISGREALIHPKNGALHYGKTYLVLADEGVFRDGGDAYAATTKADGWTFTTKTSAPASGTTRLTVAADGTGDFCSVQGALDFIPDGNTTPTTIFVRKGLYTEIVFFTNKHAISLIGEDRAQTVIAYATNDRFNPSSGNPFGTTRPNPSAAAPRTGHIYHRGVFLAHRVNDLVLANLTIRNTTPQGGSQAEAIILNGTTSAHAILKNVDLYSYQDTLQINGQAYLEDCYIEGDVDFMWGTGPCYFAQCTCRALRSGAYYTQIRNPGSNHGYVYDRCTFDGLQGVMGNYLSRIGTGRFPHSEVVLLDCLLTTAVGPVAWQYQGGREGNENDPATVHFWEFNSHDQDGKPVDMTFRLPGSKRLGEPADATTIADYRNPAWVLGGWDPKPALASVGTMVRQLTDHAGDGVAVAPSASGHGDRASALPNNTVRIVQQPANQLALLGMPVSLTVVAEATSGGRLSYQWFKDGHALSGSGSPTLRVPQMSWADAAVYTVEISNAAGRVTSAPARLTAVAPQASPAPQLPHIPDAEFDVTAFGARADGATDNTAALQKTIDTAVAAGGGTVVVPPGAKPYLCGPIVLGNYVALEIEAGATLQLLPYAATPKPGAYPLRDGGHPHFITANGAHDIAILGSGVINGDGDAWWDAFRADKRMPHRPWLVRLTKCERVLIAGLTFTRSPMFHVAPNADHLTVFGIVVNTPEAPNTDGVDPSGSHHLIQNCWIKCGDDNVVMKPGGAYCSDITIADCTFLEGHGMSVGGQSNRGLNGMVVKNCAFDSTTSALRLKADPTQGGNVENITYTNLTMQHVPYPIVFYSYYKNVGNPAAISGNNLTTPDKVKAWNAEPPQSLASKTMPAWKNITVANLFSSDTRGYSIIWGLPLEGYLIEDVKLHNVHILGGPGFEIYDATNVQLSGDSEVGKIIPANALAITRQPGAQQVALGGEATFSVATAGPASSAPATMTYAWTYNGQPLTDGVAANGSAISGANTPTLSVAHVTPASAGKYAVVVSTTLDGYDNALHQLVANKIPVHATSNSVALVVK